MKFENVKYIVTKPSIFCDNTEYPTVIFMHGAGGRGNDLDKLSGNPFFTENNLLLENAVVYAPLCNCDTWFDMYESIRRFARFVSEQKNTDKSRLYLVGASMGGYAVWQMLMSDPELYAGAVPICGGGMYWNTGRIKNIDIWAFHGKNDRVVLCEESIKMVESVNKNGGNAKLTVLEGCEHNSWTYVYNTKEVFQWLLECRKKISSEKYTSEYNSSKLFG